MFKQIADEHEKNRKSKVKQMKELENKIVDQSLPALSNAIFNELSTGSDQIVQNQKEIDRKCRSVRDDWEKFNNELGKWGTMISDLDKSIQDIGDVRGWALRIQEQVDAVCAKLEPKQ